MSSNTSSNPEDFELVLVRPRGDEELWNQCVSVRLEGTDDLPRRTSKLGAITRLFLADRQSPASIMLVFAKEQGFPEETEVDEYDKTAFQYLLRSRTSKAPMGVIRFNPPPTSNPERGAKLARLAMLKSFRGKGLSDRLVRAVHDWAIQTPEALTPSGEAVIWLHSQLSVMKYYSRFGYVAVGDQFDEEGAPHQRMEVRLRSQDQSHEMP